MEKKTVYYFKNLLTFLNNKDSLPKLSFSLIEETGLFYVNGQFFSENILFNLNQLLENVTGELSEKDTTNEAVIKLYKLILGINLDTNNLIKLLVSEIYTLREATNERMDKTDEIVASGLSLHNNDIDELKTTTDSLNDTVTIQGETLNSVGGKLDNLSVKVEDHLDNKDLQHIPEGGHDRQILAWKEDGTAEWKDLATMFTGLEDILAYGVEWDINVADPHITRIGNMALHKSLPILSLLKGCIALGNQIMYWLNKDDWNFKGDTTNLFDIDINVSPTMETNIAELDLKVSSGEILAEDLVPSDLIVTITLGSQEDFSKVIKVGDLFKIIRTPNSYPTNPKVTGYAKITSVVGGADSVITLVPVDSLHDNFDHALAAFDPSISSNFKKIEFIVGEPSRLDGYDGTVRVYCPNFYIKSLEDGDKRRVWISTVKIDDTWEHQHEILVDAYRSTALNTVPENMGYLSTIPVRSAISVVNTHDYCRGGGNRSANDAYLETDPFRSDLGKPRTSMSRSAMRTYSRNAGSEMLSYEQYKNIFYWLYVIEYANFNCQEAYNEALTTEGYRQGGLGDGVTTIKNIYWSYYNGLYPLTPCGYCNEFGNGTGLKTMTVVTPTTSGGDPTQTYNFSVPRWRGFDNPFGDIWTNLDGIIIQGDAEGNPKTVYITTDPNNYGDNEAAKNAMEIAGHEIHQDGYTKEFDLGEAAHIIPESVGGDTTKYKCDYHWAGSKDTSLRTLFVGGCADYWADAGLGVFGSIGGVSYSVAFVGFRSVSSVSAASSSVVA